MLEPLGTGIFQNVSQPVFGKQDLGLSPLGAMDLFSYETGNALLGNRCDAPALEMIFPPSFKFTENGFFVLTGAHRESMLIHPCGKREIRHGRVYRANTDDILKFGEKCYGLRTYLCYKPMDSDQENDVEGRERGLFTNVSSWTDREGKIRVLPGPEWTYLKNQDDFFTQSFTISPDSNAMGLRLVGNGKPLALTMDSDMISEAVSDGTVQLTPKGPVVLLRHRQTLGGYPRIFNVISADIDRLAQYAPGEILRFRAVSDKDAMDCLRQRKNDLDKIKNRYL